MFAVRKCDRKPFAQNDQRLPVFKENVKYIFYVIWPFTEMTVTPANQNKVQLINKRDLYLKTQIRA